MLLEWIFNKLVTLAEVSDEQKCLTQDQTQKLTLVFDKSDLMIYKYTHLKVILKVIFLQNTTNPFEH